MPPDIFKEYIDVQFKALHDKMDTFIDYYKEAHQEVVDDVECNKREISKHNGYINRIVGGGIIVSGLLTLWAKFGTK